jgi:hypothetical protein
VGNCLVVGYADATDLSATFEWDSANPGAPVASDRRMNVVFRRDGSTITLTSASVQFIAVPPEINVTGNGQSITSGDATPTTADHTDFGSVGVSAAAGTRTFTIQNTGAGTLTLGANAVSVSGADAARFSVTAQPATTVAASGSTTFTVAFDPLINGAANATLSIANDDADENPYTFAITGTGTGGAPEINVTGNGITILSGDTMPQVADGTDFGNVNVDGGQVSRSFVIQNTGSADLNLGTVTLDSVGSFTITSNPRNTTVAPGGTTTVTVQYDPDFESIDRVDLFIFNDDADESTYSFALQGTAINGTADIAVTGNGQAIASGDINPSVTDHTDFGSTGVTGGQVARTYTLTNPGSANASLTGTPLVAISGAHAGDFSVTSQPANATISTFARTFVVRFDPSAAGLRTATVSIDNNVAGKNPYTFAIAGTGTAVPPEINVTGNGQAITSGDATPSAADHTDFGSVVVSAAAGTRTFTIENTGAGLLTLGANAVSVSGADAARFSVTAQPATTVAASGSTTFTVAFDPLINGAANATLSIANDDADENPYTFAITGTGIGGLPEINVTGNGITILDGDNFAQVADGTDFGSAEVSGGQASRNFIIQNTGTADLSLGTITITGLRETFWSKTLDPSNTTVAPGATATLTLQFDPAYQESAGVIVNIPNNDADEAVYNFAIRGTGINGTPDIAITGNSQTIAIGDATPSVTDHTDFGLTDVTGGQVARTFTVTATGTSNVELTGTPIVALAGAHAADFSVTSQPASTNIPDFSPRTFVVTFDPSAAGLRTATVSIDNNVAGKNPYTFAIAGTGTVPAPEIDVTGNLQPIASGDTTPSVGDNTDFGDVGLADGAVTRVYRITNSGSGALTLGAGAVTLSGAGAAQFTVTSSPDASIPAGDVSDFIISYNPNTLGAANATVSIANDDTDESPYTFAITGNGVAPEINVTGNGITILSADQITQVADGTDFGSVNVDGGQVTRDFIIQNTGTQALNLGAVTIDFPDHWSLTADPSNTSIAPGGTATISARFDPAFEVTVAPHIEINSNDADEARYFFSVRGQGINGTPDIAVEGNGQAIAFQDATPSTADHTDFGTVTLAGAQLARTFTITGPGTANVLLTGTPIVSVTGAHAADFTVTTQPGAAFASRSFEPTFIVTFDPSAAGLRTATVSIPNNTAGKNPFTFDVQGTGGAPEINVTGNGQTITSADATPATADHTDFGSIGVAAGAITRTFTIENTGSDTLTLGANAVSVGGADAARFTVTAQPATSVAASGSTTFTVAFDPLIDGAANATLSIANDDADENPYTFAITGTGTGGAPEINVTGNGQTITSGDVTPDAADHTDFGSIGVAAGAITRTFTIQNTGSADLTINGAISILSPQFTVTRAPVSPVPAGGSTTFDVAFDADFSANQLGTLEIPSNDADEGTYSFRIQGTGTGGAPDIAITGNGVTIATGDATPSAADFTDFGNATIGVSTVSRNFRVSNTGSALLTLTGAPNVSIGGAHPGDFVVTAQPGASVLSVIPFQFTVQFNPTAAGARTATVSILNDVPGKSPYTFAITGNGTALSPEIAVTGNGQDIAHTDATPDAADHTDFGGALVPAGTVVRTFTIQNAGAGTLNLGANAVSIAGAQAADYSVTAQPATQVAAAGSSQFTITFDPSAVGARTATISIANDDADEAPFTFAISGTGQAAVPEIAVRGNGVEIVAADATPSAADLTDFGATDVATGTIARSFTIANTGTGTLTLGPNAVSLAGANAADFTVTAQPAVNVAAAATTTFTLTFDPSAGGARAATVTITNDDADEAPYTFAIAGTGQVGGTITLVQMVTGPDVTTEFSSPTAALNTTLTSVGGTATLTVTAVPVGSHTVTAANLAALGYGITAISCNDNDSSADVANASATIVLAGGETVVCTFVVVESRAATSRMIADFLGARGTFLLSNQPGSGRRTGRFSGNAGGSGTTGSLSAFGLSGAIPVPLQAAFSGDTLSFASSHGWGQAVTRTPPDPAGRLGANDNTADAPRPVLDLDRRTVWIEGTIAGFDDRQSDGTFGVVYAGADQLVTPDILVGALVQYDWFRQEQDTGGGKVTGRGWMAGPYATFRLDESLFADIRFAWGKSRNDVTPIGTYTDTFDTTRWLGSGAFIGDFAYEDWSIQPTISLVYLREAQKRYTDSLGIDIPGQSVSQGEVKAGPRIGYAHLFESGDRLEPFMSLEGAYVFGDDGLYSDGSLAKEVSGLRGRLGYGLDWRTEAGQSLSVSGTYDGIGTNANILGVSLKLSVPLN